MSEHGAHGHHHDRGWRAVVRYIRLAPKMWSSSVNDEMVEDLGVRRGEAVLDIGAGMGSGTIAAAKAGARVTAVEPTPFLRGVLRMRRLGQRARRNIDVRDGAAEHLPVSDSSVDAAWAVNVMHHWTDVDAAINELHRVLRAGGRVLLVDENFDDPEHPEHDRIRAARQRRHLHFDHVDPAVIGDKLTSHGFSVQEATGTRFGDRPAKVIRARRS